MLAFVSISLNILFPKRCVGSSAVGKTHFALALLLCQKAAPAGRLVVLGAGGSGWWSLKLEDIYHLLFDHYWQQGEGVVFQCSKEVCMGRITSDLQRVALDWILGRNVSL